jgi:hypothetical protein
MKMRGAGAGVLSLEESKFSICDQIKKNLNSGTIFCSKLGFLIRIIFHFIITTVV